MKPRIKRMTLPGMGTLLDGWSWFHCSHCKGYFILGRRGVNVTVRDERTEALGHEEQCDGR